MVNFNSLSSSTFVELISTDEYRDDPNKLIALFELVTKVKPTVLGSDPRQTDTVIAKCRYIHALAKAGQYPRSITAAKEFVTAALGDGVIETISKRTSTDQLLGDVFRTKSARESISSVLYFLGVHVEDKNVEYLLSSVHMDACNVHAWRALGYLLKRSEKLELFNRMNWLSVGSDSAKSTVGSILFEIHDEIELSRVIGTVDKLMPDLTLVGQIIRTYLYGNRVDHCVHFIEKFPSDSMLFKSLDILPLISTVLYKGGRKDTLFTLASYFMSRYGNEAFFITGMYYMSIGRHEIARKFFAKVVVATGATGPQGWLAYGVAFSLSDESGRAINAYRKATVLYPNCLVGWLYIGQEYLRTNELKLAQSYIVAALNLVNAATRSTDPVMDHLYRRVILNEMGVLCLKAQQYEVGVDNLKICCSHDGVGDAHTVSVYFANLGYAYIRIREYDNAMVALETAVEKNKTNANALAGLGYCHHLRGDIGKAIDLYNCAMNHTSAGSKKLENVLNSLVQLAINEFAFSIKQNHVQNHIAGGHDEPMVA